jgi:ADP-heptose:LPS heptosyltransferase
MPQPPLKLLKRLVLAGIAHAIRALRGSHSPTQADLSQLRNFLFLQYESPLGSVVHATPLFEALKRVLPDAHITIAASQMAASVLGHNPHIDRCVITPNPLEHFSSARRAVRRLLQSTPSGPRSILTTIGNQRTRVALVGLFARKTFRVGYTLVPELYDVPLRFEPERGQIEGNLDILRSLGHSVEFCEPRVFFSSQDAEYAAGLLEAFAIPSEAPRIAVVTQNSGGQRNRWSEERFRHVIAEFSRSHGAVPVFVGTCADAAAIESLRRSLPDYGISVAGKTTVPQLAAVLAQCDLVISLDTGTFHVARAVGLPGVVIAPAWQSALEWLPVGNARYRVLQGPCIAAPPADYWIEEIGAQRVIEAALQLLDSFPPSVASRAMRVQDSIPPSALRQ